MPVRTAAGKVDVREWGKEIEWKELRSLRGTAETSAIFLRVGIQELEELARRRGIDRVQTLPAVLLHRNEIALPKTSEMMRCGSLA